MERGGKAILLLNRRGVAPALHCRACGETRRCPNCDVALVLHRDGVLRCHHCGFARAAPETLPGVRLGGAGALGAGTQRLERELAAKVPELELIRLDADAVAQPGALHAALARFAPPIAPCCIGTQMVAKGHHFTGVALAAVVDADTGLGLPDFRAEERTFQLLTQLAGRSGRDAPGACSSRPSSRTRAPIALAARHDVRASSPASSSGGARSAIRRSATSSGSSSRAPTRRRRCSALDRAEGRSLGEELLGPAPLLRLRGRHRAQLVAKTERPRRLATQAARLLSAAAPAMRRAGLTAVVDVDPQGF